MNQLILVLGSFILLMMLTVSVDNAVSYKTMETYQVQSIIVATTLAQGLVQEISLKEFDQNTIGIPVDTLDNLTAPSLLGKEYGETVATFNDLDDYQDYVRYDTVANGYFTSTVSICYVQPGNLETASAVPTFYKKVSVTVNDSEGSNMPITLSTVIAY